MNNNSPIKLRIPRQDLAEFTVFALDVDSAQRWVQELPVANAREVVVRLRDALEQLNRVELSPELRFNILETLRPGLQVALSSLSRYYLNQPLVMPQEPQEMAELAARMYQLYSTAYTLVAIHAIQRRDSIRAVNPARLVCEALQRGLYFCGRRVLHALQLYRPVEPVGWHCMHQLYSLAERQQLTQLPLLDRQAGGGTIEKTYLQVLMLGCCKPNQLRQSDLGAIYRGLQDWVEYVHLDDPETGSGLFIVNLDGDEPPMYSTMYPEAPGIQCRFIETGELAHHLQSLRESPEYRPAQGLVFDRDTAVTDDILRHVIASLEQVSARNFTRTAASEPLEVVVGLSDAHFYLAGELDFGYVLYGPGYRPSPEEKVSSNPFLTPEDRRDMWQRANPTEEREMERDPSRPEEEEEVQLDEATRRALAEEEADDGNDVDPAVRYPIYTVRPVNASPGGYCLSWSEAFPRDIRTGELVAARENPGSDWALAVIRWIGSGQDEQVLLGVELLSPRATPCGVRPAGREPAAAYLRALLLPEIQLVGQVQTIIVPRTGFREGLRVELLVGGQRSLIQLQRQIGLTASFMQFEFRAAKTLEQTVARLSETQQEEAKDHLGESPYDSLWDKI